MIQIAAQTPSPRLSIAVFGAGRIGSSFASRLARNGGHEVTVVARPNSPRLARLQRDGGIVDINGTRPEVLLLDELDADTVRLGTLRPVLHRAGIRPAGAGETIGQIVALTLRSADRERLDGVAQR